MNSYTVTSKINRTVDLGGKEFLYFSGTSYLGMGALSEFEEMVIDGIRQYGTNYGASRWSNVQLDIYEEMETFFATQAEAQKAVVVSSGFMAGHVTATVLKNQANEIWVAPDTHPAILPEGIIPDASASFDQFKEKCLAQSHRTSGKQIAIFANAVDPLSPLIHTFDWVGELSDLNSYSLLLDDSHAFGLIGKGIFGTYSRWKKLPVRLVISGSLGKALGIPAGIVLGPSSFIKDVTTHPCFIGASPPAPGYCKAFLNAQLLYAQQQKKLQTNRDYFISLLKGMKGIFYQEDFPTVTFEATGWAQKLMDHRVLISSFPYPNLHDAAIDRVIVSAYHQKTDLDFVGKIIEKVTTLQSP